MSTKSQIELHRFSEIVLSTGESLSDAMIKMRAAAEQKGLRLVFLVVDKDHRLCISGHLGKEEETLNLLAAFSQWIAEGDPRPRQPGYSSPLKEN